MTQHIHFIGIGGTGLSAIARVLLESGYIVSGSDQQYSPLAQAVEKAGARVYQGHCAENIAAPDLVIRSSAIPDDNPEVVAARQANIPVLKRADFLGRLMEDRLGVAIAGSHGKTTTTAMLAWVLTYLEQQPSFICGGDIANLGVNARAGDGAAFVIEADEYDYMFLGLKPRIAVITNVEHDHPDIFPTPESFRQAFLDFVRLLPSDGILLTFGDDPGAAEIYTAANGIQKLTYSLASRIADYAVEDMRPNTRGGFDFTVLHNGEQLAQISLQVPGQHNVANALAALVVIDQMQLPVAEAAQGLSEFIGAGRRFQVVGEVGGITLIDDYAHHPTEIRATLAAARARYPAHRIWAVWQPHTYSRSKLLFDEFVAAFDDADQVLITEIYRSREAVDPNFSSVQIATALQRESAHYAPNLDAAVAYLKTHMQAGDVVLVLSAGDATKINANLLADLPVIEALGKS